MQSVGIIICWLTVYDKDDFPLDRFDNTESKAISFNKKKDDATKIKVAWSNESVELWFLLHFQDYYANNGREQYIDKLKQYFEYEKREKDIYKILQDIGSEVDAIRRAKALEQIHRQNRRVAPTKMIPMTKMYALIEELNKYKVE